MSISIGCDAHKRYSLFAILNSHGQLMDRCRVDHVPGAIREYLSQFPKGTVVALESVGNWYWIVDEIEASGFVPRMAHAAKAKACPERSRRVLMGNANKTDKPCPERSEGSMQKVWRHCSILGRFLRCGSRLGRCAMNASCLVHGWLSPKCERR